MGYAQQKTITGLVSSEGIALPGVNILVKGTTNGVVSDFDGNYSISIDADDSIFDSVLVFSYVGFETLEVEVDGRNSIDAVLIESTSSLDEVIVVGYGTQKVKDVTGAIGTIGAETIEKQPVTSIEQALGGNMAGVHITSRGGDAASPISVRIRGVGTTGNNQPLYVVDGIPLVQTSNQTINTGSNHESSFLSTLNPNDIESINVLKDASSAAIYGARAANGVVIITTKRGKVGKAKLTYDFYTLSSSSNARYDMLNTEQYIDYQDELQAGLGEGHDFSNFRGNPTTDWQDAIYKTGTTVSHNLSASGGSETANYMVSASYFDQEGTQLAQEFNRYSISANSDIKIGKIFKVGESFTFSSTDRLMQSEPGAAAHYLSAANVPFWSVYDSEGEYNHANYEQ